MKRYTAKNRNSYGEFYEDEKLKYIFSDLAEARFVTEFGNEKQETIDTQNARADAMNKRNSELEDEVRRLKAHIIQQRNGTLTLGIEYKRVMIMLAQAMKTCSDEKLCADYEAWCNENLAETYAHITNSKTAP